MGTVQATINADGGKAEKIDVDGHGEGGLEKKKGKKRT